MDLCTSDIRNLLMNLSRGIQKWQDRITINERVNYHSTDCLQNRYILCSARRLMDLKLYVEKTNFGFDLVLIDSLKFNHDDERCLSSRLGKFSCFYHQDKGP